MNCRGPRCAQGRQANLLESAIPTPTVLRDGSVQTSPVGTAELPRRAGASLKLHGQEKRWQAQLCGQQLLREQRRALI
eukprot:9156958-Pyramimonas_sp.AAC.1